MNSPFFLDWQKDEPISSPQLELNAFGQLLEGGQECHLQNIGRILSTPALATSPVTCDLQQSKNIAVLDSV